MPGLWPSSTDCCRSVLFNRDWFTIEAVRLSWGPSPHHRRSLACDGDQDVLVYAPAVLIFFEAVVPLFVRHKIREELDAARKEPIAFKHQIPQGEAAVIMVDETATLLSLVLMMVYISPSHSSTIYRR
jgi:hypothetical protein